MANTWIIDIRDFLKEDYSFGNLTRSAERVVNYFGSIVEAVTSRENNDSFSTEIPCRRRPGHRRCNGKIIAVCNKPYDSVIDWYCPVCGDKGSISGWQSTRWDFSSTI